MLPQRIALSSRAETAPPVIFTLLILTIIALFVIPNVTLAQEVDEPKPLEIEVFMSSEEHLGFGVASTLIYGEKEAVLVDTQFTNSNALRVLANILESGRELTYIYITHEHPDHWFAVPIIKQAFPDAKLVSIPGVVAGINGSLEFNLGYWGKILGRNGASSTIEVEALESPYIMLEGRKLEIIGSFTSDAHESSSVWIPSIKTLIAGDAVFSEAHPWLADSKSPKLRQEWVETLNMLEKLNPEVVVPGHAPSNKYLSPSSILFTRNYLELFEVKLKGAEGPEELFAEMKRIYPYATCELCLYYSTQILKGGLIWDAQWPPSLRNQKAE